MLELFLILISTSTMASSSSSSSIAKLPLSNVSLSTSSKSHHPLFSQQLLKPPPSTLLLLLPSFNNKSLTCYCSKASSQFDREEQRWLREEHRWLREEQRWLREEQRWLLERESLLREIADLRLQLQALERRLLSAQDVPSSSDAVANVAALLQALKDKSLVLESGSKRMVLVEKEKENEPEEEEEEEVIEHEKEIVVVEEAASSAATRVEEKRSTLRKGSEGEEVRAMQEALQKLGFYSGEEDMEYSSFSTGTERAVKTWQAGLGATEDGVMTSELLERLYLETRTKDAGSANGSENSTGVLSKEGENGAVVASVTEISEVRQKIVRKDDVGTEASHPRVFLLGENRWEEPSRLVGRDGVVDRSKNKGATTKCLQCRGEGRLLCTECDGTGEPNIEPQFMEWVEEGTKCPYCEGLGYTICDVCEGKTMV